MHIPRLEDRITQLLAAAYQRDSTTDTEYQQTFEEEGSRKSKYIIDDLLEREKNGQLATEKLLYLCIGGADGSELEHVLRSTGVRQAMMVEISEAAAKLARDRARRLSDEIGKTFLVIEGDVTSKLIDVGDKLTKCKSEHDLNGIACSAQAVLHELPWRSPGFDYSVFFGKIFRDPTWETVAFYSREPCIPPGLPEVIQLRIKNVSGDNLRRFGLHVATQLRLPKQVEDILDGWVRMPGIVAVELLHKLLRNDTTTKLNYELEEQLTGFDPRIVQTILEDHVPGIKFKLKYINTEGFKEALELHDVEFRNSKHEPLPAPMTHVRIIGVRTALFPRVISNLGAPPYSRFIQRKKYFGEILEGLAERTTPLLITGMSGMGKTSLAHEVAQNALTGEANCPRFDAVVWISDKASPGSVSLNAVLDEIARTLDYAGLAKLELPEKRRRIEDLARSRKVLVVVDSFETVVDTELSTWLCNVPEPSKAIVTTLKGDMQFPVNVTEVHVLGMNEEETRQFVEHRLSRLKLDLEYSQLSPLLDITKGNPKAIEIALGIIKRKKRPLVEVVDTLAKAKPPFHDFCSGAWALLDNQAQMLLLATYYFPYGTQDEPLKRVSKVEGTDFDRAVELLDDLGQLDLAQNDVDTVPTYSTHGLVNAFVGARLNEDTSTQNALRRNWLAYLEETVAGIGLCWNDIGRLTALDEQSLRQTVLLAIDWSFQHGEYASTIAIARDVRYYFYVRGFWSVEINLRRAEAARLSGDDDEEFAALTYHLNIASKQGNLAGVEAHLRRLAELAELRPMSHENVIRYQHALALYSLAKQDYTGAEKTWVENLAAIEPTEFPHEYSANTRWLAVCYEKEGRIAEAHALLVKALDHAGEMHFTRGVVDILLKQATLYIKEQRFEDAEGKLKEVAPLLEEVRDRSYDAHYSYVEGRVCDASGRDSEAQGFYERALDAFERLGLNDRAIETKTALEDVTRRLQEPDREA